MVFLFSLVVSCYSRKLCIKEAMECVSFFLLLLSTVTCPNLDLIFFPVTLVVIMYNVLRINLTGKIPEGLSIFLIKNIIDVLIRHCY